MRYGSCYDNDFLHSHGEKQGISCWKVSHVHEIIIFDGFSYSNLIKSICANLHLKFTQIKYIKTKRVFLSVSTQFVK